VIDSNGFIIEEEFLEWLDNHVVECIEALISYFGKEADLYKNYPAGGYYSLLQEDAARMSLMIAGIESGYDLKDGHSRY